MPLSAYKNLPLVSVIIPCYNHGSYLSEAIKSIWQQDYLPVEIIVVDDGSTDNTKQVTENCKGVLYIYQQNQGLSAARNTGIKNSQGELLIFLDADDWLLPGAVVSNATQLLKNEKLAFVSGAHDKVFVKEKLVKEDITEVDNDHYCNFLKGNYIGMHATVMYRRWIFDKMLFDTSLKMCEDYDLYLRIAKKYPVAHHTQKIAAYRLHTENMSNNIPKMLSAVITVLLRQKNNLASLSEKKLLQRDKKTGRITIAVSCTISLVLKKFTGRLKIYFCYYNISLHCSSGFLLKIFNHD